MTESSEKETKKAKEAIEEKENSIITLFKRLLDINYHSYGGKKEILK